MKINNIELRKHKVIGLLNDDKESQGHFINSDLIAMGQLDVFLHFVDDLRQHLLENNSDELVMHEHVRGFSPMVWWQLHDVPHHSDVFCSDACVLVPVGGVT